MQTQVSFSILLWIKKNRIKNGRATIYVRVTINGQRLEISTQRETSVIEWDTKCQSVRARSSESKAINFDIATIKAKILSCRSKLEARNVLVTTDSLKNESMELQKGPGC
jgi:integrase/recombinase XerD